MKTPPRLLLVLTLAVSPALPMSAADTDAAAHDALRQIKATYEKAVASGDITPLRELFLPETTAVMTLGDELRSFDELTAHWDQVRGLIGDGGSYTTTLTPEPSLLFGDLALARGTSDDAVKTGDGREFRFQSRWTAVCRNVDGSWKVLRLHASMPPVSNVFTNALLRKTTLTWGLLGAASGLIAGFVLGRKVHGRKSPA